MCPLQPITVMVPAERAAREAIAQLLVKIKAAKCFILLGEIHLSLIVNKVQELPVILRIVNFDEGL